jgi:hypothetical protein
MVSIQHARLSRARRRGFAFCRLREGQKVRRRNARAFARERQASRDRSPAGCHTNSGGGSGLGHRAEWRAGFEGTGPQPAALADEKSAGVAIPPPPAGKKYVIAKNMHIQLVDR